MPQSAKRQPWDFSMQAGTSVPTMAQQAVEYDLSFFQNAATDMSAGQVPSPSML